MTWRTSASAPFVVLGVSLVGLFSQACSPTVCKPPRIYFSSNGLEVSGTVPPSTVRNVFSILPDGTKLTALTQHTTAGYNHHANISKDGNWVVYTSDQPLDNLSWNATVLPVTNIWKMKWDGTERTPLTRNTIAGLDAIRPQFTPDGTKIVFNSKQDLTGSTNGTTTGSSNLWVMNADGSSQSPLTRWTSAGYDFASSWPPAISPDGTKIVFDSLMNPSGSFSAAAVSVYNIWIIGIDGTGMTAITKNTGPTDNHNIFASWTMDGSALLISSFSDPSAFPSWNVAMPVAGFVVNVIKAKTDGTTFQALTQHPANVTSRSQAPFMTPNGEWIVAQSSRALDGNYVNPGITNWWRFRPDGTEAAPITQVPGGGGGVTNQPVFDRNGNHFIYTASHALDGTWSGAAGPLNLWKIDTLNSNERIRLTNNTTSGRTTWIYPGAYYTAKGCQ